MSILPETYVYKTALHLDIHLDVYRAPSYSEPSPVIVWIHGGALIGGSREFIGGRGKGQLDRYLSSGFTVASIDYRLAPETKLPLIIEDVKDAFKWIREKGPDLFHIDPDSLGVVGHSAGGYLTLMAGAFFPRPKALVSFYGYGDIVGDWYSKPDPFYCQKPLVSKEDAYRFIRESPVAEAKGESRGSFYLYCRQQGIWPKEVGGQDPAAEPSFFKPYCPVQNVSKDYPPTLLLHGDVDTDVPYQQSVMMAQELKRVGVENELVTIKNGGHGFEADEDDSQVRDAWEAILAFLNNHLAIPSHRTQAGL